MSGMIGAWRCFDHGESASPELEASTGATAQDADRDHLRLVAAAAGVDPVGQRMSTSAAAEENCLRTPVCRNVCSRGQPDGQPAAHLLGHFLASSVARAFVVVV